MHASEEEQVKNGSGTDLVPSCFDALDQTGPIQQHPPATDLGDKDLDISYG